MNLSETARVLAMAAAFDQRTVGETDVYAWQSVLDDVSLEVGFAAVQAHYREHRERIMPADIRRYKRETPGPEPVEGEECEHGYPAARLCPVCRGPAVTYRPCKAPDHQADKARTPATDVALPEETV